MTAIPVELQTIGHVIIAGFAIGVMAGALCSHLLLWFFGGVKAAEEVFTSE